MERLDKVLAGTGRWSRREVKELVRQGRVRVDGQTARTAEEKVDPEASAITVGCCPPPRTAASRRCWTCCPRSCGGGACRRWGGWIRTRRVCCC